MKKTPFLSYILAALLACTGVHQAQGYAHVLTDENPELDTFEMGTAYWNWIDYQWSYDLPGTTIEVKSKDARLICGRVGGRSIDIRSGARLTLAPATSTRNAGGLLQNVGESGETEVFINMFYEYIKSGDYKRRYVYMENNSGLDYRDQDLWLGILSFEEGATVNIKAGNLVARSIRMERDATGPWESYTINAKINIENLDTKLVLHSEYANIVTLKYDQNMNLEVVRDKWEPRIDGNGKLMPIPGTSNVKLNGYTLNLIDGKTSTIQGYLSGSAKISLGNGTALNGLEQARDDGYTDVSWLLNDIIVRENCSASMNKGRFGGKVTMQSGSSLFFDVGLISRGQDSKAPENVRVAVNMAGKNTLNLAGRVADFDLSVYGTGNTLQNGTLNGTLTLMEGSYLKSEAALSASGGSISILMIDGAKLAMGNNRWINDISKITVVGNEATVVDAYLRIKRGTEYTVSNGVENLKGEGRTFYALECGTLNLGGKTSNLAIGVWANETENYVKNGTIDTYVEIDPNSKLTLQGVSIGEHASFYLKNNTQLDLGRATGTAWISLASGAMATVSNVQQIGLQGGTPDNWATYTLGSQDGKPIITGMGLTVKLGGPVMIATNKVTRFLVDVGTIGNRSNKVNVEVTTDGRFILGQNPQDIGGQTQLVMGEVSITKTGAGSQDANKDVDIFYQLVGKLKVEAANGRVNAGIIGEQYDTTSIGEVNAKQIYLSSFIGKSLTLNAANNGGSAIEVKSTAQAAEDLTLDAEVDNVRGDIKFGATLSGRNITLTGKDITGEGNSGDSPLPSYLDFREICTIDATEAIDIHEGINGGALTVTGGGDVVLDLLGIPEGASLASAKITSQNKGISMRAFTGGTLSATAQESLTIREDVKASGNVELKGASVGIGRSLTSSAGSASIRSTDGDITLGGALSSKELTTLNAAGSIIGAPADVTSVALTATAGDSITLGAFTGSTLTATAGGSIRLKNIGNSDKAVGNAELTANGGIITASSFNGATLKATATGAVTIDGNVKASGNAELKGASVSIGGSLASSAGSASITSTTGDISLGGALSAAVSTTLNAAGSISGASADVTSGALTATAGGSITLGNISIGSEAAALTATGGSITAGNFTGGALTATAGQSITLGNIGATKQAAGDTVLTAMGKTGAITASSFNGASLKATAKEAVTINGDVTATSGNVELTGGSVGITGSLASSAGSASITSTTGDISLGGALSAKGPITLDSAGSISGAAADVLGGALTATAGGFIRLKNIGTSDKAVGNAELKANGGSITASSFNGASLKATATGAVTISGSVAATSGNVELKGASVGIDGSLASSAGSASITSTGGNISLGGALSAGGTTTLNSAGSITAGDITAGELTVSAEGEVQLGDVTASQAGADIASAGNSVKLGAFTGQGAQISALKGSIQVASAVSGSGHTFLAGDTVAFNGSADLQSATIRAQKVTWANGATLSGLTLTGVKETDSAQVTAGGSLALKDNSRVQGNLTIDVSNAKVTVDNSTVTGSVSGATYMNGDKPDTKPIELELNNGAIGGVGKLTGLTSAGTSSIAGLAGELVAPTLTLNGGELTLQRQTNEGVTQGQVLAPTLTVTKATRLNADLELSLDSTLNFSLTEENTATPLLAVNGQLTAESSVPILTINLAGDASVEGGKSYALISVKSGETPDFWADASLFMTVTGLGATEDNLSWENGILYYRNGTALKKAVWTPGENHLWNTVDQNWTQDGHRYRYKDGVDVVFNNTGLGGDVQLEGEFAPKDVQVEGTCDYTFKGTGKITGATALTKNGTGTLTIENANTYSGGTTINAGTLVVANAQALGTGTVSVAGGTLLLNSSGSTASFGTVTLTGGTVQIANGDKAFNLYVNSNNACMEGDYNNAFTGSLTLTEGSKLSVQGALSGKNGMKKIEMGYQSTLAVPMYHIDGLNNRIWINRVSEFTVDREATLADVLLCLAPDGEYTLGAMTGNNVNSLQNLRGTGVTAYWLDGSTLDLNQQTNHLNIVAWKENSSNDSRVKNGTLNTDLYIRSNSSLYLENAIIGRNATFEMCEGAYLNMGGYDVRAQMSRFAFDADGSGATIDNGTIIVNQAETDRLVTLCRGFLKGSFSVSLVEGTVLDLDMNTLYIASTGLEGTSASIGNGTINGRINVGSGQTLSLFNNLYGNGTVYLGDNAGLNLGGHNLGKDVDMTGSTSIDKGCLTETVSLCGGTLDLGGTLYVYGMNLQNDHAVALNGQTLQVDHTQLAGHTLTLDGAGTLDALEAFTGGAIAKTGEGRLNIQGPVQLTGLDVQGGDTTVTGTEETKISIGSLKAAAGSTIELVHTNATAANEALAYKGNLVIGNGSTVTAGGTDGWAYGTDNSLTIQQGGKLDLGNYRWSFASGNKVTLAGGEIAGSGSDAYGAIDFCDNDNVVAVTEDSTLSARMRVRGSVAFDVCEGKELSFTGGIVSSGAYNDDKGTVSKTGAGTMVMSGTNALGEGGAVNVQAGTLKVTGNSNPLGAAAVNVSGGATLELGGTLAPTGVVNLAGGTLKISDGSKDFALTVTGTDNRMEGNYFNAFIGSLTLEENSRLVSAGSMASWDGPRKIVMKDGSTLEMDTHKDFWIHDITNLTVEGEATMVHAFLRINPKTNGGVYTLGNGVQNLKGEGVTAYCLDGSTFNLNRHTTNLGIIVWNSQDVKDNVVEHGTIDTKMDIHQDSRLILSDVEIGNNATFFMGDRAYLDMGGGYTKKARLSAFSFAGASVTINNGMLLVADGESVHLRTELLGDAIISLGKEANLDLNGYTLAGSRIELADASATVSGGKFSGDVTVASGKTLRLGVEQSIAGVVTLEKSTSTLSLGSDCSVEGAISGSGTIMKEGIGTSALSGDSLKSFTGSLEVQGGILNLLNAASVNVQDVTIQNGSLGVYSGESANEANEATLTIKGSKTLTAGKNAALNANLVMGGGGEGFAVLDVHAMAGQGGLQMGSTVTLTPGNVLLSEADMDAVNGLRYMQAYDLFSGVDRLSVDGTTDFLSELGLADKWVKAADVFANDLFKEAEDQYYVFYSGATQAGGAGGNVGTVYIMQVPEPTTSTLSLLALCALAARRRRKD